MTPKISTFIIALIWVSFFAAIFGTFIATTATNYGLTDQSNLSVFNKMEELNTQVEEYKESSTTFQEQTGVLDVIGSYFSNGYRSLLVMAKSLNIFTSMTNEAISTIGYDIPGLEYLKTAAILTIAILIIIGVMVSAILKKDV